MKILTAIVLTGILMTATQAVAHPTGVPYASRGECESAYAHASKFDRERLTEQFGVTPGEAQKTFRDLFRCEYDVSEDAWFIVFIG